ncbi:MAG: caspase family protein [Muribaculum sp.]|nr:caspase family protein [Muribaculum sp.]
MRYAAIFILLIYSITSYGQSFEERKTLFPKAIEAAKNGNSEAEYLIGYEYIQGEIVDRNVVEGINWLTRACNHGNDKAAQALLWHYINGELVERDYNKAFQIAKQFAEQGNIWGLFSLGTLYSEGIGCEKNDILAFNYIKKAVDLNYIPAHNVIGICYHNGIGVEKNDEQAYKHFKIAADNGFPNACYEIGKMYMNGWGIPKNQNEGFRYFKQGAQLGDTNSMCALSKCYYYGAGTSIDLKKAIEWAEKAANLGVSGGYASLAEIYCTSKIMFNPSKALENIDKAIEILSQSNTEVYSEDTNGLMLSYLEIKGKALLRDGKKDDARLIATEIATINPQYTNDIDNELMDFFWGKNNSEIQSTSVISECKSSDVDINIPMRQSDNNKTFAIIIGNERYTDIQNVDFANHDASIFAEYCKKALGLPEENIKLFLDATYGKMLSAVEYIKDVASVYEGELNIIFYYAGHGIPNEKTKEPLLLPTDNNGKNTTLTLPMTTLIQELSSTNANKIILFLDACFSGSNRGEGLLQASRGINIKPQPEEPKGNMIIFSATNSDETAHPYYDKSHGLFTYFLLKGLQESNGETTIGSLAEYIKDNVKKSSIVINGKTQSPSIQVSESMKNDWYNSHIR